MQCADYADNNRHTQIAILLHLNKKEILFLNSLKSIKHLSQSIVTKNGTSENIKCANGAWESERYDFYVQNDTHKTQHTRFVTQLVLKSIYSQGPLGTETHADFAS